MNLVNGSKMIWFETLTAYAFDQVLSAFQDDPGFMLLHSALLRHPVGRYSFLGTSPFGRFVAHENSYTWNEETFIDACPWTFIQQKLQHYHVTKDPALPPFQGGAMGYFSYEFAHTLESLPSVPDPMGLPQCVLHFYENVMAFDHDTGILYVIATGFPEQSLAAREARAKAALKDLLQQLKSAEQTTSEHQPILRSKLSSNFTKADYQNAVSSIKSTILNGDIFQANFTQQFQGDLQSNIDHVQWFRQLCAANPAPFSALMHVKAGAWILSASPERFISLQDGVLLTEPIKGTRKRGMSPAQDKANQAALLASKKDNAENIMIVDLMRNDVSKVSMPGSVETPQLCGLHTFETVHHLISTVKSCLQLGRDAIDVLKATFPPGSVTGAPKIKAMEVISQHEQTARGPYCGCLGYLSFTGDMDMAVTIRTYIVNDEKVYLSAGGGIVLDSDPLEEYEESLAKAGRLIEILHGFNH